MALQLSDLDSLDLPAAPACGAPLRLALDLVDEDPDQPRTEFDEDSLQELAATIRQRGVRQPVSVRRHPSRPERWMLNFGARRLRASKLAGMQDIPAFVDEAADSYDQVIENEQREGLQVLELALFIQRRLASGESQAEIARRLGKSRSYVTFVCALIDAPGWLMDLYRSGRCRGAMELYELRKAGDADAAAVEAIMAGGKRIGRADVLRLKGASGGEVVDGSTQLGEKRTPSTRAPTVTRASPGIAAVGANPTYAREDGATRRQEHVVAPAGASSASGTELWGALEGVPVRILLDAWPEQGGRVFVARGNDEERHAVEAARLTKLRFRSTAA